MEIKAIRLDRKTGKRTYHSKQDAECFERYLKSIPNIVMINRRVTPENNITFRWRMEL